MNKNVSVCVTCLDLRQRNPICPPPRGEECLCGQTANTASECADIHVEPQVWDSVDSAASCGQQTLYSVQPKMKILIIYTHPHTVLLSFFFETQKLF